MMNNVPVESSSSPAVAASPVRILLVEDEAILRMGLEDQLHEMGHRVVGHADTAADAVRLAEELRPDLVFMDIRLKGDGDGIEAARTISDRLHVPIIYLTAFADQFTIERAKPTHPYAYLHKPCREGELRAAIELSLHRHRMETAWRESGERASRENEDLRNLLAQVSHDIRNPVGVISELAEILASGETIETIESDLERIQACSKIVMDLLTELLDYTSLESGRLRLRLAPFNLHESLLELIRCQDVLARAKNLELVCDLGSEVPTRIVGDESRIRRMLINLIGNAIKFTDDGGVVVRVRATTLSTQRVRLRFEVEDSGSGMDPETIEMLFKPGSFPIQSRGTKSSRTGWGLGLVIAQKLACLMGGSLRVESQPSKGSCFVFEFEAEVIGESESTLVAMPVLKRYQILVLDCGAFSAQVLMRQLAEAGGTPTLTQDIDELMAWYARTSVGDRQDEFESISELSTGRPPRLPLVLADADHLNVTPRLFRQMGYDGPLVILSRQLSSTTVAPPLTAFLTKPYDMMELWRAIRDATSAVPRNRFSRPM